MQKDLKNPEIIIKRSISKSYPHDEMHQWAIFRITDLPSVDMIVVKHLPITPLFGGCTRPVAEQFYRQIISGNLSLHEKTKKQAS